MIVAGMLCLSYAAVPLYRMFCQVTGFGGTTQGAEDGLPDHILEREITIHFNADIDANLPWEFAPTEHQVTVKLGEQRLTAYRAASSAHKATSGTATYNVTPFEAGRYFHKIACFCFEKQTLPAQSVVNMPISFFIDPEFDKDPYLKGVKHITLSYTFFSEDSKNN